MMNNRTRLLVIVVLGALCAVALAAAFAQCGRQPSPIEGTLGMTAVPTKPGATASTEPPDTATAELTAPTGLPASTATPTEGESVAAAVGRRYAGYRRTQGECDRAVETGELESCVAPDFIRLLTRPEWERLFPNTDFYLIGLAGRNQNELIDRGYHLELAAWQDEQYFSAEAFDRLLQINETAISDDNRELVAQAFALMTLPGYLEWDVDLTNLEFVDMQNARYAYTHCLGAWAEANGLELRWCFVFQDHRLQVVSGPVVNQYQAGDFVEISAEVLPEPPYKDYRFAGE